MGGAAGKVTRENREQRTWKEETENGPVVRLPQGSASHVSLPNGFYFLSNVRTPRTNDGRERLKRPNLSPLFVTVYNVEFGGSVVGGGEMGVS